MSSDFSLPLSAAESHRTGEYRLIAIRVVTKPDGLNETFYVWKTDGPDQSVTWQFDERERVFPPGGEDGENSSCGDDQGAARREGPDLRVFAVSG